MTTVIPALSDEVMEALRPVMEAVGEQAREAARRAMQRRAERAGLAAVRALGYHSTHSDGHDAIMRAVFGDLRVSARNEVGMDRGRYLTPEEVNIDLIPEENLPGRVTVTPPAAPAPVPVGIEGEDDEPERLCECDGCTYDECQGDCDSCDDADCEQCHGGHDGDYDCTTCHDLRRCCNYCDKCDEHHDDAPQDRYDYARCDDCDHCRECDHYCD